jgi:hypothetical protein
VKGILVCYSINHILWFYLAWITLIEKLSVDHYFLFFSTTLIWSIAVNETKFGLKVDICL